MRLFSRGAVNLCTEPVTFNPVDGDCVRPLDQFYPAGNPFGSVDYKRDVGSSTYNGLNVSLERRLKNGLSFQTRYTLVAFDQRWVGRRRGVKWTGKYQLSLV